MNKVASVIIVISSLLFMSSCIKEDPVECPSEYSVKVFIKDKNYTNIDQIPQLQPFDENSPFNNLIKTINYSLKDLKTGKLYTESKTIEITGEEEVYTIRFNNLPLGQYELVVWGNMDTRTDTGNLHHNEEESTDLYIGKSIFNFTTTSQQDNLLLERAKGKLLIIYKNLPSTIEKIEEKITPVYYSVTPDKIYSGTTSVKKSFNLNDNMETILAPSDGINTTKLYLDFTLSDGENNTILQLPATDIFIKRNEISMVSVDYDEINNQWEVWTYIDGKWTLVHQLSLNEM